MNLLSEIISKPVLNLYSGKIEGTVMNALFDSAYKKIQYFKIFDADDEEYLLNTSKIYSVGNSCLVIRNSEALILENAQNTKAENNPLGLEIYSSAGDNLSVLTDIELEKNFEVKKFIAGDISVLPENILNIGKIVVVNNSNIKIRRSDFKPKVKKTNTTLKGNIIKIMPTIDEVISLPAINSNLVQAPQIVTEDQIQQTNTEKPIPTQAKESFKIYSEPTPQRIVGNGNFLIGRKAIKTIYGLNNEIIIRKDNIINAKNLESAKKHSKLVELTVFSKIKP